MDGGELSSFGAAGGSEADIVLSGSEDVWRELLAASPKPRCTDVFVASMFAGLRIAGDMVEAVGPFYPALQRLIGVLREVQSGKHEVVLEEYPFKDSDVAVGRYIYVDVDGVEYRVFYQEAGEGVPLLLQHTAGADSRQWRHLLADPELQKKFRMVAYDLPYHGNSLPPLGVRWWEQEYEVSKADLMKRIVAISKKIGLQRPVFMGCSVGGQLATDLIAHYPEEFRGSVSLNGFYQMDPFSQFTNEFFHHPRISDEYFGALMYGFTSPLAPEQLRRESHWIYASGGPGVYKGDNEYYMFGHDLREDGHLIDTKRTPLWVIAGEYDPTVMFPECGAKAIAENVPGAILKVLPGLSHFMISDDPVAFREQIIPILDEVLEVTAKSVEGAVR